MHSNAGLFMTGGSETTSSELAALLYLLCQHPDKMKKLMREIRSEFANEAEISMEKLGTLKYLNACISEGLRLYPPLALGLPRVVPKGGAEIAGSWIPGSVRVLSVFLYTVQLTSLSSVRGIRPSVFCVQITRQFPGAGVLHSRTLAGRSFF
jgi:hypothetical protein